MTTTDHPAPDARLRAALQDGSASGRLQSALAAGTYPNAAFVDALVERCAVEPDFYVRDMLTWALTRHPSSLTVPRLLDETRSAVPQARTQALHTLSKIGDPRGWSAISREALHDPDDQAARTAWRTAVRLVPAGSEPDLAEELGTQLGRGDRETQRSLTRSIATLGDAAEAMLSARASRDTDGSTGSVTVRVHALATMRVIQDPDEGFEAAMAEAKLAAASTDAPTGTVRGPFDQLG